MQTPRPHIPPGAYISLSSASIPVCERIEIARCLWKFSSAVNKEQIIISSVVAMLKQSTCSDDESKTLWGLLSSLLTSKALANYFETSSSNIELNPPLQVGDLTQRLDLAQKRHQQQMVDHTTSFIDIVERGGDLPDMITVTRMLVFHKRIASEYKSKFLTLSRVTSSWLRVLDRFVLDDHPPEGVIELVFSLIGNIQSLLQQLNIKRSFFNIVSHCLVPALKVLRKLAASEDRSEKLTKLLEEFLERSLFSKDCMCYFSRDVRASLKEWSTDGIPDEASGDVKTKRQNDQTFHFWLRVASSLRSDELHHSFAYTLYKLPLRLGLGKKTFHFFTSLTHLLDLENKEKQMETLQRLLKLNLDGSIYQPAVDEEFAQAQKDFYLQLVDRLLGVGCSADWSKCLVLVATIEHDCLATRLPALMDKLLLDYNRCDAVWMEELFSQLLQVFSKVREPLRPLSTFADRLRHQSTCEGALGVCGAFGGALSSQPSPSPAVVLDTWELVEEQISLVLAPWTEEQRSPEVAYTGCDVGLKRKSPQESSRKRAKLDPSLLQCYVTILAHIASSADVLDLQLQATTRPRLEERLHLLRTLTFDLRTHVVDLYPEVSAQYYHLAVVVCRLHTIMTRYSSSCTSADVTGFLTTATLRSIEGGARPQTPQGRFNFNKWLVFKIEWLNWRMDLSREEEFTPEIIEALKQLMKFTHPPPGSWWDGRADGIADEGALSVATFDWLRSSFVAMTARCDQSCFDKLAKLILKNYSEGANDKITMASSIRDLMTSEDFIESRPMQTSLLKRCIKHVKSALKDAESSPVHQVLQFAMNCLTTTDDDCIDTCCDVAAVFSLKKKCKRLRCAFKRVVPLLRYFPLDFLPTNEKRALLAVVTCALATLRDVSDVVTIIDEIIGSQSFQDFSIILLPHVIIPSLSSHFRKFSSESRVRARRVMNRIVTCFLQNAPTGKATDDLVVASSGQATSLTAIMEPVVTLACRHSGLRQPSPYVIARLDSVGGAGNPHLQGLVWSPHEAPADDVTMKRLRGVVERLLRASSKQFEEEFSPDLARLCLVCFHSAPPDPDEDSLSGIVELARMQNLPQEVISSLEEPDSDPELLSTKLQLLCARLELVINSDLPGWEHVGLGGSWIDVVMNLVEGLTSKTVKIDNAVRMILERCVVAMLLLVPSTRQCAELMKHLRDHHDVRARVAMTRLITSCYDAKRMRFSSVREWDDAGEPSQELAAEFEAAQVSFLLHSLDGAGGFIDDVTSSDDIQSQTATLSDVLAMTSDLISLTAVTSSTRASEGFRILVKINLRAFLWSSGFQQLFNAFSGALLSLLSHHRGAVSGWIPMITSQYRKMVDVTVQIGRQTSIQSGESALSEATACSRTIRGLSQFLSSNYKSFFRNTASYLLADYAHALSKETLHPSVQENLDAAFHTLAIMTSDSDIAMLKTALPPGVRVVFRNLYEDYQKFFRYRGLV